MCPLCSFGSEVKFAIQADSQLNDAAQATN